MPPNSDSQPSGFKTVRPNQVLCFVVFFLVAWVIASVSLLLTNRRRDPALVSLILVFFSLQALGGLLAGVAADLRGRRWIFCVAIVVLFVGLIGGVSTSSPAPPPFVSEEAILAELEASVVANFDLAASNVPVVHKDPFKAKQKLGRTGLPDKGTLRYALLMASVGLIGLSVGAVYPVAGVVLAESVAPKVRTQQVATMFCMQGLGHLSARSAVACIYHFDKTAQTGKVFWMLLIFASWGCFMLIVAATLLLEETPVFMLAIGSGVRGSGVRVNDSTSLTSSLLREEPRLLSLSSYWALVKRYSVGFAWDVLGTSLPWFIFDCSFYGDGVFHFLLVQRVKGFDSDPEENLFALVVLVASLLGYILAAVLAVRFAPKLFQILGFAVLAFVFFGLALSLYSISHSNATGEKQSISQFLGASLLYDIVFRFFNFIPNLTTFLIPLDAFPTKVRGFFVGLSLFFARLGAIFGILLSWTIFETMLSRSSMLLFCAGTAVLGAAVTRAFTPCVPRDEDLLKLDIKYLSRLSSTRTQTRVRTTSEVCPPFSCGGVFRSNSGMDLDPRRSPSTAPAAKRSSQPSSRITRLDSFS